MTQSCERSQLSKTTEDGDNCRTAIARMMGDGATCQEQGSYRQVDRLWTWKVWRASQGLASVDVITLVIKKNKLIHCSLIDEKTKLVDKAAQYYQPTEGVCKPCDHQSDGENTNGKPVLRPATNAHSGRQYLALPSQAGKRTNHMVRCPFGGVFCNLRTKRHV